MHPLAAAWIKYKNLLEFNLRQESWYYATWLARVEKARQHYQDMMEHYGK